MYTKLTLHALLAYCAHGLKLGAREAVSPEPPTHHKSPTGVFETLESRDAGVSSIDIPPHLDFVGFNNVAKPCAGTLCHRQFSDELDKVQHIDRARSGS